MIMTTRDKLEYQKRLRFLREARAKTASEQLKLAKRAEESNLTKRMVTLGDKENRVPARGETPKAYNETPKTGEESLYKDPVEGGDKKEKKLDVDLSDLDRARISEQKRFYVGRVGEEGPYENEEDFIKLGRELGREPGFFSDEEEAGTLADQLIDLYPEDERMDFDVRELGDEDIEEEEEEEDFLDFLKEATPPQEDADQSLLRFKKRKKATRTKALKRKSHAKTKIKETLSLDELLRECGCEMESPFDAPEDEPQGYMLVQNLEKLGSKATELANVANHDDDAEPWIESKINSAAEHIDAVYDYIKYGRKHKSDMTGHEDMHISDNMMTEVKKSNLKKLIERLVAEQTVMSPPIGPGMPNPVGAMGYTLIDPWAGAPSATPTPAPTPAGSLPRASAAFRASAINPRTATAEQLLMYILDPSQYVGTNASFSRLARLLASNNERAIPRSLQITAPVARGAIATRIPQLLALLGDNAAARDIVNNELLPIFQAAAGIRIPVNPAEIPPNSRQRIALSRSLADISSRLTAVMPRLQAALNPAPPAAPPAPGETPLPAAPETTPAAPPPPAPTPAPDSSPETTAPSETPPEGTAATTPSAGSGTQAGRTSTTPSSTTPTRTSSGSGTQSASSRSSSSTTPSTGGTTPADTEEEPGYIERMRRAIFGDDDSETGPSPSPTPPTFPTPAPAPTPPTAPESPPGDLNPFRYRGWEAPNYDPRPARPRPLSVTDPASVLPRIPDPFDLIPDAWGSEPNTPAPGPDGIMGTDDDTGYQPDHYRFPVGINPNFDPGRYWPGNWFEESVNNKSKPRLLEVDLSDIKPKTKQRK
jgi:hypothetical protein